MNYTIRREASSAVRGEITLAGSKSISNRALIIRALSGQKFDLHHLANAKDTILLNGLLNSTDTTRDAGAAGTTYRFMTAYLSMQQGSQILTGTDRMKQRPIGVLAEALKELGANIEYLEKDGYPPLKIGAPNSFGQKNHIRIAANTSSQYISALLMIAPTLPEGLKLELTGKIVSRPYIEMTLKLMAYFGVKHSWDGQVIQVAPQQYVGRDFTVEADWSAASYYYIIAAFASSLDLQLNGLFPDSVQGDAVLAEMMPHFGVQTSFNEKGIHLSKGPFNVEKDFRWDFLRCPDLAQSIAVICAGLGRKGYFEGVETLRIKETDRIAALKTELAKINVQVKAHPQQNGSESFEVEGKVLFSGIPVFDTYEDHRMAMAFAPLGMFQPVSINEPMVVVKSYPDYYKDLEKLGFQVDR
ncbi:MAG TPA: 3-phosphoshikimate 1-carboxyvinyltransferase [Saprospiraceae bacterium]|nr:3-phosphoshikimate 1-carboxyvinyltransferase [Saprospiraceae bacterium]